MIFKRLLATPTVDNSDEPPLHIDLVLTSAGQIAHKRPIFGVQGWFGTRSTEQFYPFVLTSDGRVDFGTVYDELPNERFAELEIHGRSLFVGQVLRLTTINYGLKTFRIASLDDYI